MCVAGWPTKEWRRHVAATRLTHLHDVNRHDALVHAFVLRFEQPFAWPEFAEAIDVLLATCGERILRVKGLISVEGEPGPRVVQCVQHMRYPESTLPAGRMITTRAVWCSSSGRWRDIVEQAFVMFCGAAARLTPIEVVAVGFSRGRGCPCSDPAVAACARECTAWVRSR
jgi:G3E family GTPase